MASRKGIPNKRSGGLLAKLKEDFDLDPLLELAELCRQTVTVLVEGQPLLDSDDNPVMIPFLEPVHLIQALGKLGDKTYPSLKAQEIAIAGTLPVIEVKMTGFKKEKK